MPKYPKKYFSCKKYVSTLIPFGHSRFLDYNYFTKFFKLPLLKILDFLILFCDHKLKNCRKRVVKIHALHNIYYIKKNIFLMSKNLK